MRRLGFVLLATVVLLGSAAMVYAGNGKTPPGWNSNSPKYTGSSVTNPITGEVAAGLVREKTPDAVLAQHLEALNGCDWVGLMQQYPDSYELRLPGGAIVVGRTEAAAIFAGFVEPFAEGGLCGLTFSELSRQVVAGTISVTWEADAAFLCEPYRGADAYITHDGLMVSMVSTFDGAELKTAPCP